MKRNCPITGDIAEVVESADQITVEHPKLGQYTLDANALSGLEADAGVRDRMAHWIAESRSLGIDIPNLTLEYVHLFERLADLEEAIAEWHERRGGMKSADGSGDVVTLYGEARRDLFGIKTHVADQASGAAGAVEAGRVYVLYGPLDSGAT